MVRPDDVNTSLKIRFNCKLTNIYFTVNKYFIKINLVLVIATFETHHYWSAYDKKHISLSNFYKITVKL